VKQLVQHGFGDFGLREEQLDDNGVEERRRDSSDLLIVEVED
jgi:hypothetical protein